MIDYTVLSVAPSDPLHARLMETLSAEPIATQWWEDAESRAEPAASYMVVYVTVDGALVPAAWAGWIIETEGGRRILRCCNNYVRRGFRNRAPELYALAYRARHRQVVSRKGLPAVTYLFPEPIGLHLASGWRVDTGPGSAGTSRSAPDGPVHHWQRLRWAP